jgi:drug/metabolite transporter (DMT)-like permease
MASHVGRIPPFAALTLASAFWGIATVISKALLTSIPPLTFLIVQLIPSVCVLWTLVLANGRRPRTWRGLLPVMWLGLLNPGLSYTLSMLGLARTTASAATLLWAAEPALIVLGAWLLLREKVTPRFLVAITAAAFGVVLVSGTGDVGSTLDESTYGAALILGGVLCCALYTVMSRKIAETIEPLSTVAIQQTVGLAWAIGVWLLEQRHGAFQIVATLSSTELLGGALSGLMYYAAAFWLYLNALRSVSATTASIFLNLTPVFAVATAYLFLGERLSPSQWVGAATILLSVLLLLIWAVSRSPLPRQDQKFAGG